MWPMGKSSPFNILHLLSCLVDSRSSRSVPVCSRWPPSRLLLISATANAELDYKVQIKKTANLGKRSFGSGLQALIASLIKVKVRYGRVDYKDMAVVENLLYLRCQKLLELIPGNNKK
jgi:hypothetical protein